MSPLPEILFEVARNPILAGESSSSSPSGPSRPARLLATADNDPVGLPIGLGAASGFITGRTSRSNWFTVSPARPADQT
jgi:benzodiazapine receptor